MAYLVFVSGTMKKGTGKCIEWSWKTMTGEEARRETLEASPAWPNLIREFAASPGSNVLSLPNYDADRERSNQQVESETQTRYSRLLTPACINEITRKVNSKKSLTPRKKRQHFLVPDNETFSLTTKPKKINFQDLIQTRTMWQSNKVP